MSNIPAKILPRLTAGIKKFQSVLATAKAKDINESDTVVIITDMLSEVFGFDKYSEITSEFAVKKTWCDLAIKIEDKVKFLIEVKAIGLLPKEDHIKQAVDYGSNSGVDWVILTNGIRWRIYKIIYGKPISHDLVYEFDFLALNTKKESDLCLLYYVSKESLTKSVLEEYHVQKQSLSNDERITSRFRGEEFGVRQGAKKAHSGATQLMSNEAWLQITPSKSGGYSFIVT